MKITYFQEDSECDSCNQEIRQNNPPELRYIFDKKKGKYATAQCCNECARKIDANDAAEKAKHPKPTGIETLSDVKTATPPPIPTTEVVITEQTLKDIREEIRLELLKELEAQKPLLVPRKKNVKKRLPDAPVV